MCVFFFSSFRLISNFNAILSIILAVYSLVFENDMTYDNVWYSSKAARLACGVVTGYVIAGKLLAHLSR